MTNDDQRCSTTGCGNGSSSQRVLVLDGVLDDDNGTVLATQLLSLASEDPTKDIALWINSPGGSVPVDAGHPRRDAARAV